MLVMPTDLWNVLKNIAHGSVMGYAKYRNRFILSSIADHIKRVMSKNEHGDDVCEE
jgi:hypothetical protein